MKVILRPGSIPIWFVIALHVGWIVLILIPPVEVPDTAALHGFKQMGHMWLCAGLAVASVLAFLGLWCRPSVWTLLAFLPQQAFLFMGGAAALSAVEMGCYPYGMCKPWVFIASDQLPYLLLAFAHLLAVAILHLNTVSPRELTKS